MRGVQKGEENVRRLSVYLDELAAERRGLPARDGRPNLSIIAEACGFDRGVFYTNQKAKMLLDDAHRRLGLDTGAPADLTEFDKARLREESKSRTDSRSKSLEEEVLRLRAENASLRAENGRYRALRELLAKTGRVP
jgi:hypothetical protein